MRRTSIEGCHMDKGYLVYFIMLSFVVRLNWIPRNGTKGIITTNF